MCSMMIRYGNVVIGNIDYFYFLIPIAILLFMLLRRRYINEDQRLFNKPGKKRFLFFFRLFFFAALLLALTNPYIEYKQVQGNITRIKALMDDSFSTRLYDTGAVENNLNKISERGISVVIERLQMDDYSSIGNAILNNLAPEENILLVSDGQNNFGPALEDVSLFASSIKSRIFGIELEVKDDDASIMIDGPSKVVSGVENQFNINVNEIGSVGKRNVKVYIDDAVTFDGKYDKTIEIKKSFLAGTHIIRAVLETDAEKDTFPENNIYYKTINVYKKPTVLFLSRKTSPLAELYSPLYSLDIKKELPENIDNYYAVILDDINAAELDDKSIELLDNFVSDGNGLFVIGGKNSYDWGDYNTSLIANLLPVSVGKANKKKDVTNIMILWDTGSRVGAEIECNEARTVCKEKNISGEKLVESGDTMRAIVLSVLKAIPDNSKVGIVEAALFSSPNEEGSRLNTISELSEISSKRAELMLIATSIKFTGISRFSEPFRLAHEKLRLAKGSKLILLISDGIGNGPLDRKQLENLVPSAYNDNIKTHTYYFGELGNPDFMKNIAELGGGQYNTIGKDNSIKLHFGNPDQAERDDLSVFVYDSNHFITKDLDTLGDVYGFNTVFPKSTARMLLTTANGDPILTIWNHGLGRVASLSTDDGSAWVPDLLKQENSKMLIRTLNWLIEDPERKNAVIVDVPELRLGENSIITVRSNIMPRSEKITFYEVDKGIFKANYYPNASGITQLMGLPVAVNYKKEYLNLGINKDLDKMLEISEGDLLKNNPDVIAEKLKSISAVQTLKKHSLSWIFILAAICIYLIELLIRRIYELKLHQ